jgi:hypothetical protein
MPRSSGTPTGGNQQPPQQPPSPPGSRNNPLFFVGAIPITNDPPAGSETNPLHIKQVEEPSSPSTQKTISWLVVGALVVLAIPIIAIFELWIHQQYLLAVVLIFLTFGSLIYVGYTYPPFTWTGFGRYTGPEDRDHQPRTFWD